MYIPSTKKDKARQMVEGLIQETVKSAEALTFSKVFRQFLIFHATFRSFLPLLQFYIPWEIDGLIGFELLRNLLLALGGVFLISFVLLGDLPATVAVSLSVLLSLVDTAGFLHLLWPSTKVNIVSSIDLIMTVGVGVDYAAHVALAHLTAPPSAEDPASFALTSIGPAVLNGGATTFLAVSAVSFSKTEAFQIFFRVRICIYNLLKVFI